MEPYQQFSFLYQQYQATHIINFIFSNRFPNQLIQRLVFGEYISLYQQIIGKLLSLPSFVPPQVTLEITFGHSSSNFGHYSVYHPDLPPLEVDIVMGEPLYPEYEISTASELEDMLEELPGWADVLCWPLRSCMFPLAYVRARRALPMLPEETLQRAIDRGIMHDHRIEFQPRGGFPRLNCLGYPLKLEGEQEQPRDYRQELEVLREYMVELSMREEKTDEGSKKDDQELTLGGGKSKNESAQGVIVQHRENNGD